MLESMTRRAHRLLRVGRVIVARRRWRFVADYVGLGRLGRLFSNPARLVDPASLTTFLYAHASHVAQTALYGYLKTRAGTRFPELFENPRLLLSMNMAKWQLWLACLSDLAVYIGGLLCQRGAATNQQVADLLGTVVADMLREIGTPADAAPAFAATVTAVHRRLAHCDYARVSDDESAFSQSPQMLYEWAPIAENLKDRDREIVINSVRFRWLEVRRHARRLLDAEQLLAHATHAANVAQVDKTRRHNRA